MGVACLNFVEKTFTGGCKIAKFVKDFSLKSFPVTVVLAPSHPLFVDRILIAKSARRKFSPISLSALIGENFTMLINSPMIK